MKGRRGRGWILKAYLCWYCSKFQKRRQSSVKSSTRKHSLLNAMALDNARRFRNKERTGTRNKSGKCTYGNMPPRHTLYGASNPSGGGGGWTAAGAVGRRRRRRRSSSKAAAGRWLREVAGKQWSGGGAAARRQRGGGCGRWRGSSGAAAGGGGAAAGDELYSEGSFVALLIAVKRIKIALTCIRINT